MKKFIPNMLVVLSVLFITLVSLPQTAMAKAWKAYVVEDDTTLTFYYDAKWGTRSGTTYDIDAKQADDPKCPAWAGSSTTTTTTPNARITKVVFDSSFKAYKPTSTERWFFKCTKVVSFEGIENLCTDQVTDMSLMFYGCESLKTIDVSYFNTANVKEMEHMFAECYKLTTIYCDEDWNDRTNRGGLMFNRCYSLKGIARYQDKSDKLNLNMANAATGYFTSKAYVVVNDGTLTFYYGTDRTTCTGSKYGIYQTWPIEGLEDYPIWTIQYDIKKVVFDKSFQVFKPTTTK
ncbi:MAG: BspA family leucine-rich repeat surface protein, partial [Paraprevotella sp.]|nr:BspA family leucine-rich repeat surface protein [Paraprevotella sp.]